MMARKRIPVPESVINQIVRDAGSKTQQEIADDLNKAGHTTASGRPWTTQTVWHVFKNATGRGFPRQDRASSAKPEATSPKPSAGGKRSSGPISKTSQASGTSRGGTGRKDRSK